MRSPATSGTSPNSVPRQAYRSPQYNLNQQNSTRQSIAVSPAQNPRVSNIINNGTGSPSISSAQQQQRFYAASAPSSSTALFNGSNASPRTRPPVPLFQSTGSIHQQHNVNEPPLDYSSGMNVDFDLPFPEGRLGDGFSLFPTSLDSNDVPEYVSEFEAVNRPAPASDIQTVSPKDIMGDNMSAPPSATFTDLTTPGTSYEQSPYGMLNTSDTSPLFSEADLDRDANNWPPLFESTDDFISQPATNLNKDSEATTAHNTNPSSVQAAPKMSRNDSSPGSSSKGARHSFTAGVGAKRRDKPLPEIHVDDPNDVTAMKRARNTMAARKSRQKRMERSDYLESKVEELQGEVEHWKAIALSRGHVE